MKEEAVKECLCPVSGAGSDEVTYQGEWVSCHCQKEIRNRKPRAMHHFFVDPEQVL